MKITQITYLLTTLIISSQLWAMPLLGPHKVAKSNSGIRRPKYQQIVDTIQQLHQQYPTLSQVVELGTTAKETMTYALLIRKADTPTKKLVLVTGATHGNEYLHIADQLMQAFLERKNAEFDEFLQRGGAFLVIPIFNPDGYNAGERENGAQADLNRDFSNLITDVMRFNQPETQNIQVWLKDFLERYQAKLIITMDYHCCYGGGLLFPWGFTRDPIPQPDRAKLNQIGQMMQQHFGRKTRYGAVGEILWYLADGSSQDYYYAKYHSLSMTYEGRYRKEKKLIKKHISWWRDIIFQFGILNPDNEFGIVTKEGNAVNKK